MTRLRAASLAVAALVSHHAMADEPGVQRSYDAETKQTLLYVSFDGLSEGNTTHNQYGLSVHGILEDPAQVEVYLSVNSNRVEIFDCDRASLTANGKKVVFATPFEQFSGEQHDDMGGSFYNTIKASLTAKRFARLASASRVKGKFCGRTFTLRPEERAALRQLAFELGIPK